MSSQIERFVIHCLYAFLIFLIRRKRKRFPPWKFFKGRAKECGDTPSRRSGICVARHAVYMVKVSAIVNRFFLSLKVRREVYWSSKRARSDIKLPQEESSSALWYFSGFCFLILKNVLKNKKSFHFYKNPKNINFL